MPYNAKLMVFIGYNQCGKNTLAQPFIDLEVNKRKGRVLIIVPDVIEWRQYPELIDPQPGDFHNISCPNKILFYPGLMELIADPDTGFFDGLIIFDDCRCYFDSKIEKPLHTIITRRPQRMTDIIAMGHGFTEIPPVFFTYANEYALFYTQDSIKKRKDVLGSSYDKLKQAVDDVNELSKEDIHYYKIIKAR